jgi:hypothetical protein
MIYTAITKKRIAVSELSNAVKIDIGCLHFSAEVISVAHYVPSDQHLNRENTSMNFKQGQR